MERPKTGGIQDTFLTGIGLSCYPQSRATSEWLQGLTGTPIRRPRSDGGISLHDGDMFFHEEGLSMPLSDPSQSDMSDTVSVQSSVKAAAFVSDTSQVLIGIITPFSIGSLSF